MTNATKTLLIIFGALLVITGVVKWSGSGNVSQGLKSKVLNFDASKIDHIKINESGGKDFVLKREGRKWQVRRAGSEQWYKADTNAVYSSLDQLNSLMPQAIVTRDPTQFIRYQVDTSGTRVSLMQGTKPVAGVVIGKFVYAGGESANSYVRPVNTNTVYSVNGFLSSNFKRTLDDWRDKRIWQLNRHHIKQIDMEYPADSSFSMINVGTNEWMYKSDTLKSEDVSDMIDRLASLNADSFADNVKIGDFGEPLYRIVLHMEGNSKREIDIKSDKKDKKEYLLKATDYPYVFQESKSLFNSEVLRSKKDLIKKAKKKVKKKKK